MRPMLIALALVLAAGCSADQDDPRVAKIRDNAPSWVGHSDQDLVKEMDATCDRGTPSTDGQPEGVTLRDYAYLQGIALATCEK